MKTVKLLIVLLLMATAGKSKAQSVKAMVIFNEKDSADSFNPYDYFSEAAIERRIKQNLPLFDYKDLPVKNSFVEKTKLYCDSITVVSRWLNAAFVYSDASRLHELEKEFFVKKIELLYPEEVAYTLCNAAPSEKEKKRKIELQTDIHGRKLLREKGLDGSGIIIAIIDAGFKDANTNPWLAHLFLNNKIIATHDFVKNNKEVYHHSVHGTNVLSCIAGKKDSIELGLGTGAKFLLARTENAYTEPLSEEENWLAAAEWVDKLGASIINSSLAYTYRRYLKSEMDGHTSIIARATRIATRKGILVVSAAGNEATGDWKTIGTPADVDSVLSVGGIDRKKLFHSNFSSFGPNAEGKLKPNVSSLGNMYCARANKGISIQPGTSFSTPMIAGYVACVWQNNPDLNNMEIFKKIETSSSLFPYFDYAHGYGVPHASRLFDENISEPAFTVSLIDNTIEACLPDDFCPTEIDFQDAISDDGFNVPYFFYHITRKDGVLTKYQVLKVEQQQVFTYDLNKLTSGQTIRMHYKGYTYEFTK